MRGTPSPALLRWAAAGDKAARARLIRTAWTEAYGAVFTPFEVEALFHHRLAERASWADRRHHRLGSLVLESDGRLIGTAGLSLLDDGDGELTSLYVLPSVQGQGHGRRLFEAAAGELTARGCEALWVWVLDRSPARRFYAHLGALPVERGEYAVGGHVEPARGHRLLLPSARRRLAVRPPRSRRAPASPSGAGSIG